MRIISGNFKGKKIILLEDKFSYLDEGDIIRINLITTKNKINTTSQISFIDNGYQNFDIDFKGKSNKYKTIDSYKAKKENIPVIALDKRFSNKINFKNCFSTLKEILSIFINKKYK